MSWTELARQVRVLATWMRALGIVPGDRVVAYLPNTPEAIIAMYATASIGAVWSSCGPDFGARGVLDRYSQLTPKLIFCVDGYSYGGKLFDKRAEIRQIIGRPADALRTWCTCRTSIPDDLARRSRRLAVLGGCARRPGSRPRGIPVRAGAVRASAVHSVLVGHHGTSQGRSSIATGASPSSSSSCSTSTWTCTPRQRMFFFTSTGWMMWNFLASSLLMDAVPVLYDGNPAWPTPDLLWKMADDTGANLFGASPTYQAHPREGRHRARRTVTRSRSSRPSCSRARLSRPNARPGSTRT